MSRKFERTGNIYILNVHKISDEYEKFYYSTVSQSDALYDGDNY